MVPIYSYTNTSSSYIVIENTTNRILDGKNVNNQYLVASTAKILTAITVIENYNLEEEVIIKKEDTLEVGSKVYLKENEKIKRIDLLHALMLRSANDAASALSFQNSNEFIKKMNNIAKKIGMVNSVFVNSSGLDEKEYNLSTAYDMAILASYVNKNKTFVDIASKHQYKSSTNFYNYNWINKHKLVISNDDFIWGKTGYTKKSKRILVSNYSKDNKNLTIVTINDPNDWNTHKKLVEKNSQYNFVTVLKKGIYNINDDINYYISVEDDLIIPIKINENEKIKIVFILYKVNSRLEVYLNDNLIIVKIMNIYDKKSINIEKVIDLLN